MGVSQDEGVNFFCRDRGVAPVALTPFFRTLKESAIDQDLETDLAGVICGVDEMFGTGNGASGSQELDVGQEVPPERLTNLSRSHVSSDVTGCHPEPQIFVAQDPRTLHPRTTVH